MNARLYQTADRPCVVVWVRHAGVPAFESVASLTHALEYLRALSADYDATVYCDARVVAVRTDSTLGTPERIPVTP